MSIFKAYDVRGKYPSEINETIAGKIGYAVPKFIEAKTFAIARDVRKSAPAIANAAALGAANAGCEVIDLGLTTTPMLYFAVGKLGLAGGLMITASHNPPEYIGFKVCRENAIPIGEDSGLKEIEKAVANIKLAAGKAGGITKKEILPEYKIHILSFVKKCRKIKIVVDTANGAVGTVFNTIFSALPIEVIPLCFEPNGNFPNHEPNPLKDENIRDISEKIKQTKADFGAAFDGDGDRCIFLDGEGRRIPSDMITVLLAKEALKERKGASIVYDLRSSWVVKEEIEKAGGKAIRERVGHAFIKQTMRRHDAILGGELSGHYYFKENYFCDSGIIAFAKMLNYLASDERKISQIIESLRRYYATGEANFHIEDKDAMINKIAKMFKDAKQDHLDGITIEYPDWWFNLRKSNTEPLLRLNLEAKTPNQLEKSKSQLFEILGNPV